MARENLVWNTTMAGFPIILSQHGQGPFYTVQYGEQIWHRVGYATAAARLGEAMMHALACEGKLVC